MPAPGASADALLQFASQHSRYLQRQLQCRPGLAETLAASVHLPLTAADMRALLAPEALADERLKPALRHLRARVMAHVIVRDLCGLADLPEVTETMTTLADVAVAEACRALRAKLVARHGEPLDSAGQPQQLVIIGMGKLGGRELNVSSDIDLIFLYPEDGDTAGPASIGNFEFFTKLGRQLINALHEVTADGQVFRVDMRLRPNGDSGPLVCSFDMLENYFITQGREWERYAWIKARPMEGQRLEELAGIVRPFVFRKYLDFGAFNAMRDLHAQIRREVARRDMADNVKLGPGGIREIEFIAQVFQLIRGGRDRSLQIKPTLSVLALLSGRGVLPQGAAQELTQAYDFLRRVEHRLQFLDDAQTHNLPGNEADQASIANTMGFDDYDQFLAALNVHRRLVTGHFEAVFANPNEDGHELDTLWAACSDGDQTTAELSRLGYQDPAAAAGRLAGTRAGSRYQQMPQAIKERFDDLIPRVIQACAECPAPDETLNRMFDLLDAISRRAAYLALLQQYPQALHKVAAMMSASSWAAQYLTRHPVLLDELLDARLLDQTPDWPAWQRELQTALAEHEPDQERQMDLMREAHHAQLFRLLAQDLAGNLTVEALSDHLSAAADAVLALSIELCWAKLRKRHRETPRFAVIGYGKLGGKELGYASDLDIVFLYDDDDQSAAEFYARLAQRMLTWLSTQTPAGSLFETDTRLRPNGESGLLVSSLEAFRQYQNEHAWVWEHQALTRARYCAGDPALGTAFEELRDTILRKPRDRDALRTEVRAMRQKMMDAHGNKSSGFNLKHDPGGLIDVEFIVQYLVLGYAHDHPRLTGNLGNIALLHIAAELGLIGTAEADAAADAYRELRRLQHALRLSGAKLMLPPEQVEAERAAVRRLWSQVLGD